MPTGPNTLSGLDTPAPPAPLPPVAPIVPPKPKKSITPTGLYSTILGVSSKIYIETRGLINPPRLAALALSTPNSSGVMGFLAAQGAGLLGGSAMRPGDMVFKSPGGGKPISVTSQNQTSPGTKYYIRENPYPPSIAGKLLSGQQSVKGALIGAARAGAATVASSLLPGGGGLKGLVNKAKNALKKKTIGQAGEGYGDTFNKKIYDGPYYAAPIKTITHYNNGQSKRTAASEPVGDTTTLGGVWTSKWDILNDGISNDAVTADPGSTLLRKYNGADNTKLNTPYVLFQQYGKETNYLVLPGAISGISETVTPEWQNFKYVGSPFNTYRYGGVERSLKFNVKPSAYDEASKKALMRKLDYLRLMAFPDENISEIKYGTSVLYGFNPNLFYVTIHGMYKKVLAIITDVSININDDVPWPTDVNSGIGGSDSVDYEPFPAVVEVSIAMKIIESIPIEGTKIMYQQSRESKLTNKKLYGF